MKIAIYARVSTRDEDQNPDTQLLPLREWAAGRGTATEYVDYASAADPKRRTAWAELHTAVRRRQIATVAVLRLDRAFRSMIDMHNTLSEWDARGVVFISLTQPIDTGTATGRLTLNVLGAVAEFERELIAERVREGMERARSEGKQIGRPERKDIDVPLLIETKDAGVSWRAISASLGIPVSTLPGVYEKGVAAAELENAPI